jgi:hypothetical protein
MARKNDQFYQIVGTNALNPRSRARLFWDRHRWQLEEDDAFFYKAKCGAVMGLKCARKNRFGVKNIRLKKVK